MSAARRPALHGIVDPRALSDLGAFARAVALGGLDALHLRAKGCGAGELAAAAARVRSSWAELPPACPRPALIINDRVDVAVLTAADGVQLPEGGLRPAEVRSIWGERPLWIGRSVHDAAGAEQAAQDGADAALFGHVFATASKPGVEPRGLAGLAHVVAQSAIPVLAIGGIRVDRVQSVLATGCAGVAVLGALVAGRDPHAVVRELRLELDRCGAPNGALGSGEARREREVMPVHVIANGKRIELRPGETVRELLARLELAHDRVAVAVDGEVVPRSRWAQTSLRDGQEIELIQATAGG